MGAAAAMQANHFIEEHDISVEDTSIPVEV
jgi:hypothetical protein